LRDIFLAIHIIISSEDKNDLIVSSVLGGMNEILRAYQQIKLVQGKKRLRNLYVKLVQADFLIKSAHLNTSFNSKFLLQNIFNNQDYQIKNDIKLESLLNEITTFYEHISKMNESCHLFEIDDKFFRTTIEKMYQECNSMNIKKDIQK
jgi:outer membrane protein assembly factor BamA